MHNSHTNPFHLDKGKKIPATSIARLLVFRTAESHWYSLRQFFYSQVENVEKCEEEKYSPHRGLYSQLAHNQGR
jgi:hypothetical protein